MTDWFMPPVNHLHAPMKRMALPGAIRIVRAVNWIVPASVSRGRGGKLALQTSRSMVASGNGELRFRRIFDHRWGDTAARVCRPCPKAAGCHHDKRYNADHYAESSR